MVNTKAAEGLAMQEDKASTAMILTGSSGLIPASGKEGLLSNL